jgi:hypothetical protein
MPKVSSHLPDKPLRILYVADYQSDKLIKTRGIRNNLHTGGSAKIARITKALRLAKCEVTVLASGIVANKSTKLHRGLCRSPSLRIPTSGNARNVSRRSLRVDAAVMSTAESRQAGRDLHRSQPDGITLLGCLLTS